MPILHEGGRWARLQNTLECPARFFSRRFRDVVGQTPMDYLTRWRMLEASNQLIATQASVASVRSRCWFMFSESAFKHGFQAGNGAAAAPLYSAPKILGSPLTCRLPSTPRYAIPILKAEAMYPCCRGNVLAPKQRPGRRQIDCAGLLRPVALPSCRQDRLPGASDRQIKRGWTRIATGYGK